MLFYPVFKENLGLKGFLYDKFDVYFIGGFCDITFNVIYFILCFLLCLERQSFQLFIVSESLMAFLTGKIKVGETESSSIP